MAQPKIALTRSTLPRGTTEALEELGDQYPEWVQALPSDEPIYAIPKESVMGPALQHVFTQKALEAERAFSKVCRENQILGVWGKKTVVYQLLTDQPLRLDDPWIQKHWPTTEHERAMIQSGIERAETPHDRLRGVVGWLLTEPAFLTDIHRIRTEYEALSLPDRPIFPLGRMLVLEGPGEPGAGLPKSTTEFALKLRKVLDRWGLVQLTTWELPSPQGPLLPNSLPATASYSPTHGVHLFVPVHYPIQGDDDLLHRVKEYQQRQAIELGVDSGFGGIAHHLQYAKMFRMIQLEWTVKSRFNRPPRGLVSAIEEAATKCIGMSAESVRRLRMGISKCRDGGRGTIPWLRVGR